MGIGSGLGARRVICGLFASAVVALVGAGVAQADTALFTFENPPYTAGSINGQDGWSSTGPYDHEVDTSYGIATFGAQSLRLSNAVTSGSFGDQTFSRSLSCS